MTSPLIEIKGDKEILARMAQFPQQLEAAQKVTMDASLTTLWENVPPYPAPPTGSTYTRTGTHGRKLGSGYDGGAGGGKPSIFQSKKVGGGFEGRFGTNNEYSAYVIGDDTQAEVHQGRWYKIGDIAKKSEAKILGLWNTLAEKLAKFIDGKGL